MSKYTVIILLFALVAVAFAANPRRPVNVKINKEPDLKWWTDSRAALLNSRSFEGLVGKDKYIVIQFCATFSKDCEALQPEYNKLADLYTGATPKHKDVFIGKIDGWTFNSLSQTYSVKKFPTIRLFNKNDAVNSDEYSGEMKADKISEWIESVVKAKEAPKAGEPKEQEAPKEVPKENAPETKQPEPAANNQANQQQQTPPPQQQQQQQTPPPQQQQQQPAKTEEDVKKEFKLVLNTTLLQAQFDEVQNQLNKLSEALHKNLAENFKKVETLNQAFESHKTDFHALSESLRGHGDKLNQLGSNLNNHKEEIKSSVTRHAEDHLSSLKDSVNTIKNKVHERKAEEPSGSGFMGSLIFMVLGGALGGAAVYFMAGGNKKRRSMLD